MRPHCVSSRYRRSTQARRPKTRRLKNRNGRSEDPLLAEFRSRKPGRLCGGQTMRQCQHHAAHRMLAVVRRCRVERDFGAVAVACAGGAQLLGGCVERTVHTCAVLAAFVACDTRMRFFHAPARERGIGRTPSRQQIDDEQQQRYVLPANHIRFRAKVRKMRLISKHHTAYRRFPALPTRVSE